MTSPITYSTVKARIDQLTKSFRFLKKQRIGTSCFGRALEALFFGYGKKVLIMTACHHGSEHLTAALLTDFAEELALCLEAGERRFGLDLRALLECFCLVLVPIVNPDGMALATEGLGSAPIRRRQTLVALNRGCDDFTHWQANGRGVDLNHNYDFGFCAYKKIERECGITAGPTKFSGAYPESESETRAICRLVRQNERHLAAVFSFHSQGEVIYYHPSPQTRRAAFLLSQLTGYENAVAEGTAAYGGLTDWLSRGGIPSFTFEIGKGENPLPDSLLPHLYATLREALFRSLTMF